MDGRRFDGIARGWAGGANRRTALRSLASLLLAAWGAGKGLRGAGAQEHWPTRCASTADCRAGLPDECVRANCWSGRCGYVCCDAVFPSATTSISAMRLSGFAVGARHRVTFRG